MHSFRLTTSEQLLNYDTSKKAKSHRGWRNISRLEAHPGQGLGELHRIYPTVRGHVRLTSDVDIHLTDWRGEEKGIHVQEGVKSTYAAKKNFSNLKDYDRGMIQAEQCHLLIKLNLHSKQTLTFLPLLLYAAAESLAY